MARIAGVDLPREKRIEIALTYIYGIGRTSANKILAETGINPDTGSRTSPSRMKLLCVMSSAMATRSKATCAATWQWTLSA